MSSASNPVDRAILGLGHFLADFFAPASTPRSDGGSVEAPFVVSAEGIAGRTRLGPDLAVLHRPGVVASVLVFSWAALGLLLRNVGERWAMIPSRGTELVQVEVRQQLEPARLAEPRARWFIMVLLGALFTLILSRGAGRALSSDGAASFVGLLFGGATWLSANLLLLVTVRRIGERLFRTSVTLEYGYPQKTRLLVALSDAPIAEQRQAATQLLQTLAERGPAPWDYLDAQGGRGLGLAFGGGGGGVGAALSGLGSLALALPKVLAGLLVLGAVYYLGDGLFRSTEEARATEERAWAEEARATAEREEAEERERTHPRSIPEAFRGHYTRTGEYGLETLDLTAATVSIDANGWRTTNAASDIEVVTDEVITLSAGSRCRATTLELINRGGTLILSGCEDASGEWARSP